MRSIPRFGGSMPMIGFQTGSEYRRRPGYCMPSGTCGHFLASVAQTNLCRFVMSARFSTMWCLAVMVLAAGILQRVVLEAEADFLRDPRLAGHRLECPAQVLASNLARKTSTKHRAIHLPASRSDAAISLIERNRTSSSSLVGSNPRRCQNSAASPSTALTINARPPISDAA